MAKNYKEIAFCRMCKKRFTINKEECNKRHWPRTYCPECCEKYFKKSSK